jgi:hypothetical protein
VRETPGHLAVYLRVLGGPDAEITFEVSILDSKNQKQATAKKGPAWFRINDEIPALEGLSGKFASLAELQAQSDTWLSDDSLSLICEITLFSAINVEESDCIKFYYNPWNSMKKDLLAATKQMCLQQLKNSYQNGDLTDMELVCDTQVFKCHQLILSIRSQVFRAMFQNPMAEATTKKVEIKDLSPEIVEAMLLYIYTGDVPNLDELAVELLAAAEKYALEDLKGLCEQRLLSTLNMRNAVDHIFLADTFSMASLRKKAVLEVANNMREVLRNPEWKQKLEENPILLAEIMMKSYT